MQQYPIPQNITGFEFKLIGDMTVKQFAYLAGCAVIAYLIFLFPIHPLIKFPAVFFFVLLGIGLAFVPIEGRPMDRWIVNFVRALISPSQYVFHKESGVPEYLHVLTPAKVTKAERVPKDLLESRLSKVEDVLREEPKVTAPYSPLPEPPPSPVLSGFQVPYVPPKIIQEEPPTEAPKPPSIPPEIEAKLREKALLEEENQKLKAQLEELKKGLLKEGPQPTSEQIVQQALSIEKKLQEALSEKERLASELSALRQKLLQKPAEEVVVPTTYAPKESDKVKVVPPQFKKAAGVAVLPQLPNLVCGIIKDRKGDVLPNIIVEVKDQGGNPVRAFKTNKLGQFSASTTLNNGRYTIEIEDPKKMYTFDVIEIELTGAGFETLEIIAKDQEMSQREKLHQALFGGKNG